MGIPLYNRCYTGLFNCYRGFFSLRCSEPYQHRNMPSSSVDAYDLVVRKIQEKELKVLARPIYQKEVYPLFFTLAKRGTRLFLIIATLNRLSLSWKINYHSGTDAVTGYTDIRIAANTVTRSDKNAREGLFPCVRSHHQEQPTSSPSLII